MQMPDSIHGMGTTTSCDSCSDAEASPLNSSPLGVSNIGSSMVADKRQIRGQFFFDLIHNKVINFPFFTSLSCDFLRKVNVAKPQINL